MLTLKIAFLATLFVATGGAINSDWAKKRPAFRFMAAAIAILGAYFLFVDLLDIVKEDIRSETTAAGSTDTSGTGNTSPDSLDPASPFQDPLASWNNKYRVSTVYMDWHVPTVVTLVLLMIVLGFAATVRGFIREFIILIKWLVSAGLTLMFYQQFSALIEEIFGPQKHIVLFSTSVLFLFMFTLTTLITYVINDVWLVDYHRSAHNKYIGGLFGVFKALAFFFILVSFSNGTGFGFFTDLMPLKPFVYIDHAGSWIWEKTGGTELFSNRS